MTADPQPGAEHRAAIRALLGLGSGGALPPPPECHPSEVGLAADDYALPETVRVRAEVAECFRCCPRSKRRATVAALGEALPGLRTLIEWTEAHVLYESDPADDAALVRSLQRDVVTLRVINARRELGHLAMRLQDEPTDAMASARVGEVTAWLRDVDRSWPGVSQAAQAWLRHENATRKGTR